ncbi:MAG: UDP-N-acetylglucosamine 2-epimerase (hydrolyzing) [Myxococcaceae bacterium]|nr:UDP-N-acetylglucosamine 2-epimerase (hydrolyzing) [Myxococcaceae bacterium]
MAEGKKRKVCVVLVDRANYGRLKPVMIAIRERPELELQIVCAGTMVLERFDQPVKVVEADGFKVDGRIYTELEGSTPATMAKSVGFGVVEFSSEFQRLAPDVVLLIGDRYEALSAALAAAYMNLCLVHLQGGEVSGSIDESARHCISKLAQFHYPATKRAAEYLVRMGERPDTILGVGCPSSDIARTLDREVLPKVVNERGAGVTIDLAKPYLLVVFHPVTTEFGGERSQMEQLLAAIGEVGTQTLLLWPNIDAGADHISKAIREFRASSPAMKLRTITNLTPEDYLRVLAGSACAVGNSSSFVRDAGFVGTPVVLVGNRQDARERDVHVTRVDPTAKQVADAIRKQLAHGRYPASALYGDGQVVPRIAQSLVTLKPYVQKRLAYVNG